MLRHPTSPQWVVLAACRPGTRRRSRPSTSRASCRRPTSSRAYPDGSATANLVGFTNTSQKKRRHHRAVGHRGGVQQAPHRHHRQRDGYSRASTACPSPWRARRTACQGRRVHQADDRPRAAVRGAAGVPAGGRQDPRGELLGRGHAAEDRRHPRHGPVAHLRPGHVHERGPDHGHPRPQHVRPGLHREGDHRRRRA